ncbi:MAG: hypothetical protein J07HB67_01395 [halophilic archaeon J07HB67]|nr:MAG: hypothetical protein J07HB67_01395 [halophilic archaeon J07HB67]
MRYIFGLRFYLFVDFFESKGGTDQIVTKRIRGHARSDPNVSSVGWPYE